MAQVEEWKWFFQESWAVSFSIFLQWSSCVCCTITWLYALSFNVIHQIILGCADTLKIIILSTDTQLLPVSRHRLLNATLMYKYQKTVNAMASWVTNRNNDPQCAKITLFALAKPVTILNCQQYLQYWFTASTIVHVQQRHQMLSSPSALWKYSCNPGCKYF